MMQEIVRARSTLTPYFNDIHERTAYHFKRHAIQNCIYGVDIDPGAVEIAKLRLWLSLVVDEEDVRQIKPLPNLDYKVVVGNSLMGFPFKSKRLHEVEKLKLRYFDEPNHDIKANLKAEIDVKIQECFAASKRSLGYEVSFDFQVYFSEIFDNKQGFDVLIGNPPYIPIESMTEIEKRAYEARFPQLNRKYDSSIVFILAGLSHLNSSGVVSYISSVTWQTGENFGEVRRHIIQNGSIRLLINLPFDMFEAAYVDTGIYLLSRQPSSNYLLYRFPKMPDEFAMSSLPLEIVDADLIEPPDFKVVCAFAIKCLTRISATFHHQLRG